LVRRAYMALPAVEIMYERMTYKNAPLGDTPKRSVIFLSNWSFKNL